MLTLAHLLKQLFERQTGITESLKTSKISMVESKISGNILCRYVNPKDFPLTFVKPSKFSEELLVT